MIHCAVRGCGHVKRRESQREAHLAIRRKQRRIQLRYCGCISTCVHLILEDDAEKHAAGEERFARSCPFEPKVVQRLEILRGLHQQGHKLRRVKGAGFRSCFPSMDDAVTFAFAYAWILL